MSRSSYLELHATDSQVLSHLGSVSLPSEPHDIRNLFSSYIYESPELNTLDGFQNFKRGKYGENQPASNLDVGLLSAANKSSDGFIKRIESDGFENSNPAAMVTGLSESLSLSSEPPDIKNLFSSYFYESSQLDTIDYCTISDYKEREDGKSCNARKSCKRESKDVMDFTDVEGSNELASQNRISDVVVKCTNMVKASKLDYQSVCRDVHNADLKSVSSIPSHLTSEMVYKQILPGHKTANSHASVEKSGDTSTSGKVYDVKLDRSLTDRASPKSLNTMENTCSQDGKSVHKLISRKDCVKESLETEDRHKMVSPTGDYWRRSTERRSIGKENEETDLLENGFISIRKKTQGNAGNITRPVRVVKSPPNPRKDAHVNRVVLSETSNFHSHNILECTGKWHCPQKNKPNLGPPLKQLCLEKWVRRV